MGDSVSAPPHRPYEYPPSLPKITKRPSPEAAGAYYKPAVYSTALCSCFLTCRAQCRLLAAQHGVTKHVHLYRSATDSTLLDSTPGCCSGLPTQSYGRLTPASRMSIMSRTPGAVNVALPAPPSAAPSAAPPVAAASPPAPYPTLGYASLVITEVADKGDPNSAVTCGMADYIEL